jgi:hypothetical protein
MARLRDAHVLLAAWEEARRWPDIARAAVLVGFDCATPIETVLELPISTCASQAIAAYVDAFGPQAECSYDCAACGEAIDILLDLRDVAGNAAAAGSTGASRSEPWPVEEVTIRDGRQALVVRALTTSDLLAAGKAPDPAAALVRSCLRDTAGQPLSDTDLAGLGAEDRAAVNAAADRLAGAASTVLRMACPGCGGELRAPVDPGDLLWERVAATAPRLLTEVATLARAFGWSEDAVLRLSVTRRRAYLELAETMTQAPRQQGVGE